MRPIVTVALGLDLPPDGRAGSGRVAIGCAFDAPIVLPLPIAEALTPERLASAAGVIAEKAVAVMAAPRSDHHAGSGYRRQMIELLLRRLLEAAA